MTGMVAGAAGAAAVAGTVTAGALRLAARAAQTIATTAGVAARVSGRRPDLFPLPSLVLPPVLPLWHAPACLCLPPCPLECIFFSF